MSKLRVAAGAAAFIREAVPVEGAGSTTGLADDGGRITLVEHHVTTAGARVSGARGPFIDRRAVAPPLPAACPARR
jgi:hypothetical protein